MAVAKTAALTVPATAIGFSAGERALAGVPAARFAAPSGRLAIPAALKSEPHFNPLLRFAGLPAFDEIKPEHIVPAIKEIDANLRRDLAALEARLATFEHPRWGDVYDPLNDIIQPLRRFWIVVDELKQLMKGDALNAAYKEAKPIVVDLNLALAQSHAVFHAYEAIRNGVEWFRLTEAQRRVVESNLLGARLSGVALEGPALARFVEIEKELSVLYTNFTDHFTADTQAFQSVITDKADLAGLTDQDLKDLAEAYADKVNGDNEGKSPKPVPVEPDPVNGPWLIDIVGYDAFITRATNSSLREKFYRIVTTFASSGERDNSPLIPEILKLRREKARLLGFETFAEISTASKMAGKVGAADKMIAELAAASRDNESAEYAELLEFAQKLGYRESEMKPWDAPFYVDKMQKERFGYDDEMVKNYLTLPRALEALFESTGRVFGVTVKAADGEVPVYHPDVRFFKVFDADGAQIASFYLDPYVRLGQKRGGAWMEELVRRRVTPDGAVQLPTAILSMNFDPPKGGKPARLAIGDLETLFHEFGHGLQQMLTEVGYDEVSGTNGIEWDAVEVASQLNEFWVFQKDVLKQISSHIDNGEPLSDEIIDKILGSRQFRAASMMTRQLIMAATDLELHHRYDPDAPTETPYEVNQRIAKEMTGREPFRESRFLNQFNHLFGGEGYAAGYYSYKWAEVICADYFSAFEGRLDDPEAIREIGLRLRATLYALGGGRHPGDVFRDFMGREFSTAALLRQNGLG
jgi:oligopeptidase A